MPYQQNIADDEIPIMLLYPRSNSIRDLAPLVPEILEKLPTIQRGEVVRIYPPQAE